MMDSKVLKALILVHMFEISVCENTAFERNIDLENEIPDAVKQYIDHVISELRTQYERRIDRLQSDLEMHKNAYFQALHRHTPDEKDKLIRNLQHETTNQKTRIKQLQMKQRNDKYVIGQMEKRLSYLERKIDGVNTEIVEPASNINQDTNITKQRLQRNTKNMIIRNGTPRQGKNDRRSMDEVRVAFFAQMTSHSTNLASSQTLVFDHAVTNIGNAYNEQNGTFIAPLAGTYVLSVTLSHYKNGAISVSGHGMVMVNDNVVAWLYMMEEQSSQTIVVQLTVGDKVSVQNLIPGQGIYGDCYSTFSGFRLYGDDTSPPIVG